MSFINFSDNDFIIFEFPTSQQTFSTAKGKSVFSFLCAIFNFDSFTGTNEISGMKKHEHFNEGFVTYQHQCYNWPKTTIPFL